MPFQGPAIPEGYDQPQNAFDYPGTPLNVDEIRILVVQPGVYQDEIVANLATIRCNDGPTDQQYETLSYTWGPWTQSCTITLNGKSGFHVTDNVFNALRRLRLTRGIRRLWIDALCINQTNITERNAQLQIMGKIYRNAHEVLVWLGDGDEKYDSLEHHINGMYKSHGGFKSAERQSLALALLGTQPHWWDRTWVVQEFAMAVKEPMILFAKYQMAYSEFERKVDAYFKWENRDREQMPDQSSGRWTKPMYEWIHSFTTQLQERKDQRITDNGNIQSGLLGTGAAHISDAILSLLQTTEKTLRPNAPNNNIADPSILDTALNRLTSRMKAFNRYRHTGPQQNLIDTAWRLRDLVCTSPHDKIFGLLALMRPESAKLLDPDYGSPIADVYALATFAALSETSGDDFRALSLVTFGTERPERERPDWRKGVGQPRTAGLPSWAVDFAFPGADAVGSSLDTWRIFESKKDEEQTARVRKRGVGLSQDLRCLKVDGCLEIGKISHVVPIAIGSETTGMRRRDLAKLAADVKAVVEDLPSWNPYQMAPDNDGKRIIYDTKTFDDDMLFTERTIITRAFELWDHAIWPQKTQEPSWKSNREEITQRLINGETVIPYPRATPVKNSWNPWNPDYATLTSRYLDYTFFTAGGSAVFAIGNGFLGIANRYVEAGDRVIMLDDESPQFLVLRPVGQGEGCEFLGFGLVHGFMRGEVEELGRAGFEMNYAPVQITLV